MGMIMHWSHWSIQYYNDRSNNWLVQNQIIQWQEINHGCNYCQARMVCMISATFFSDSWSWKQIHWSRFPWHVQKWLHNPHGNAIIEHAHQTLGNLIKSFQLSGQTLLWPRWPLGGHPCSSSVCPKLNISHYFKSNTWPACLFLVVIWF